jgi:hypothetical protein
MAEKDNKALEVAKKALGKKAGKLANTQEALKKAQRKVGILSEAGKQLKELAKDFKQLDAKERLQRIGGLVALVTLSWILKPEDAEHFKKGQGTAPKNKTLKATEAEKAQAQARAEAEAKVEEGELSEEEMEEEFDPEEDDVISVKQSATNMYAIRYYRNKNGDKFSSPNQLGKICNKEKAIPSTYILESSYSLFKEGVGTFEHFKENVSGKLVHESVKDPKERIRQAAVILSCCAVGRFQIVPTFHFKKMDWPTRGEEGLRAMYDYIRSTDRQIAMLKRIVSGQWNKYKDVGLVAVAYYAGAKTANAYRANPDGSRFHKKQYGGHASIHSYAQKARRNFIKFKNEAPGLQDLDYVAMVIEANETGRGIIYSRAKQGKGLGSYKNKMARGGKTKRPKGTRIAKQSEISPDVQAAAKKFQRETTGQPYGTKKEVEIEGKTYVFQREEHTNRDPNGAPGTTAYVKS